MGVGISAMKVRNQMAEKAKSSKNLIFFDENFNKYFKKMLTNSPLLFLMTAQILKFGQNNVEMQKETCKILKNVSIYLETAKKNQRLLHQRIYKKNCKNQIS